MISGALSEIRDHFHLSEAVEEAIVGAAKVGAFFGTFLGMVFLLSEVGAVLCAWPKLNIG